jgi:hypothetical protein
MFHKSDKERKHRLLSTLSGQESPAEIPAFHPLTSQPSHAAWSAASSSHRKFGPFAYAFPRAPETTRVTN